MEAVLNKPTDGASNSSSSPVASQLHLEMMQLRSDVEELRRENLERRQQEGYWRSRFKRSQEKIRQLEEEIEQLRGDNRKLQAQLFGRKSEKQSKDRSNTLEDPSDPEQQNKRQRGQQANRPGPKRRDYSHLPAREEIIDLPESEHACPQCGKSRVSLGTTEDSEQVEIEVRAYRRVIRRRRYRATCACSHRTFTAAPPPKLIPKGRLGVSVWLEILLEKFAGHRPIERLLEHWRLLDLDLAAGTVADGLKRLAPLFEPVYEELLKRNAQSAYAQADETRWLVFIEHEGKVGHHWWLWVFLGEDTVVYRLDAHRSHDVPEGHFANDARIVLMVDRYSAYKAMAQVKCGDMVLAFCWAHVRRDFVAVGKGWEELKEWALGWLRRIRQLYRLNHERLGHQDNRRLFAEADGRLRQAIADMQTQAKEELADDKLRAPCRKVLKSLMDHWHGLTLFVHDPRIPMDNNASERQVRGPALGRKNYYGSASLWSGQLAAMLFSIFATLRKMDLNIRQWLQWYLQACAVNGGKPPDSIQTYLPWNLDEEQRQRLGPLSDSGTS